MRTPPQPLHACRWHSPVGELLLLAHDQALCGLWFSDQSGIPPWAERAPLQPTHPLLLQAVAELQDYFVGGRHAFDLPLDTSAGTDFQRAVWAALAQIPYGRTVSYRDLAQAVGRPAAVRAVGGAIGRNPLGIVLPCHRVLGANGALTGYTGGLERKVALLRLESA
ncbi:methylated-DNA--[protein]-cysteine S-methyltransferase [Aquabacterium sp. A08]|uniref:methylated-DNA--[protein]-cysteine S-methyltransferase n=1 Tax=Aquabacterium sp. A08 TaxID=2718532 RepID=UPI0014231769|nr:methylated-DNA--[protein]-cysteine S-methyltransferase [Aquabacterium sp. A08]NIC43060.1 methylated-DNA--[protein]-cysteine S-methyltransferase [Aquabacterium sp. A08]